MVIIAIVVLVVILAVIWKFTLGKGDAGGEIMPEGKAGMPDPAVPEGVESTVAPPVPGAPEGP